MVLPRRLIAVPTPSLQRADGGAFPTVSPYSPDAGPTMLPGPRVAPAIPNLANQPPTQTSPGGLGSPPQFVFPSFMKTLEQHRYAQLIEANFPVPASTAQSTKIIDAAPNYRNFLAIRNTDGASNILFAFGRQANANAVFSIAPGQLIVLDTVVPQGDIYVLSSGAAATVSVAYSNY